MTVARTHPIILAHGIARFDELSDRLFQIDNDDADDGLHYFRNIRTHLQSNGFIVRHSKVSWAAGVVVRAVELRRCVETILAEFAAGKVHIIAHSMGGLDARQMLFDGREAELHRRIASLTTIATPHHGSPAADMLAPTLTKGSILGIDLAGFADLTTEACRHFNAEKEEWEQGCGVRFRTYAGAQSLRRIFGPLKVAWPIIFHREGPNDGLVSVRSARWKDEYFVAPEIDADHLNIIGWWDLSELWGGVLPFRLEARMKQFYLSIAEELARVFPVP